MLRSFQYRSHIQEIPRIRQDLEFLNKEWSIAPSETRQILVIIEEIFSNIVRFAFEDKEEHHVDISLGLTDNQIEIKIMDDGIAFNPMDYKLVPPADPVSSIEGGMGLTLIRTFSSQIEYNRIAGKNQLKIIKKVKSK